MYRSVVCFVLFSCALLAALAASAPAAYVVRISDLQYSPTPPNPIKIAGRVMSASPLKLNDGTGQVTVVGATALLSDFLVVTGNWDGSVLTVVGAVEQVLPPAPCEMVYIPAGRFLMGNNGSEPYSPTNELPQHPVYLSGYWIGKYEVTRGEYRRFMSATGRAAPSYWEANQEWYGGQPFTQTEDHPVLGVRYYDAEAYCAWAGGHLPTEAQWEKAARWTGSYPNVYPWGNAWDDEKCNNWLDHNAAGGGYKRYQTAPVGSYPAGASPYGLHDMAGNVWEWVADWCVSYPGSTSPFDYTGRSRAVRGGGWSGVDGLNRCAVRRWYGYRDAPDGLFYAFGFRFAR